MKIVELLLQKNVDVNYADKLYEWTALHIAAIHDDVDLIKLLILHGGDINQRDHLSMTPLAYARENHCIKASKYFEKIGAVEHDSNQRVLYHSISVS